MEKCKYIKSFNEATENEMEVIEHFVKGWKKTSKYPCPKCAEKLSMPDYKCEKCNVKLKLKMRF
jgi:hypothetical protein